MPAYVISERTGEVADKEALAAYQAVAGKLIAANGGVYLTVSRTNIMLKGGDGEAPLVASIIQFPSLAHVEAWWNSPEYRAIAPLWKDTPVRVYATDGVVPAHAVSAPPAGEAA